MIDNKKVGKDNSMFRMLRQDADKIDISMWGKVSDEEYHRILHQLEFLCAECEEINIVVDASEVEKFDFKISLDEYGFIRKNISHLKRVAIATDANWKKPFIHWLRKFASGKFKNFDGNDVENARRWVFN